MARLDFKSFEDHMKDHKPGEEAQVWEVWSRNLKRFFIATSERDAPRQKALLLLLGGPRVESAYGTEVDTHSLDDMIRIISDQFKTQQTPQLSRHQLTRAQQEPNEPIHDFVARLKRLANAGNVTNVETAVLDAVAGGCRSLELRKFALGHPPPSLNDVLRHGKLLEELDPTTSASSGICVLQPSAPSNVRDCRNCGQAHPPGSCPAHGKRCYKCGRDNHLARMCQSVQASRSQSQPFTRSAPSYSNRQSR